MAIPTDLEIEAAVPTDGTPPNRANTQAVLKAMRDELGAEFPLPLTNTTGPNEFRAQIDLIDTTPIDTASGKFRLAGGGSGNAFVDWNGQVIEDHIINLGLNFGYGDSTFRHDTTKPSFGVCWESKYWLPGSRQVYATEFGLRGRTEAGNERRLMDSYLPWDGLGYEVSWNAGMMKIGHPVTSAGGMGFQRVKFDLWPNNTIRLVGIAATGTAAGATTNAAGYAAGVSQVTLAAAGSGSLPVDCLFQFDGTGTVYAVEQSISNVGSGGVLRFSPALAAPLSAAAHTVVRVSVGAPAVFVETNNQPVIFQRNAAGTADLAHWYYDATDGMTLAAGRYMTPPSNGASLIVRGKSSQTAPLLAFQDSDGTFLGGPGGYATTGNGDGRGHFLMSAKDQTCGYEARYSIGGRNISIMMQAEGGYGSSSAFLRMAASGTGATGAKLILATDTPDQVIDFSSWSPRVTRASFSGTVATFNIPVKLPSYANVAALPTAASVGAGALAYVAATTTPGGACIIASDGAVWKVVVALGGATTVA